MKCTFSIRMPGEEHLLILQTLNMLKQNHIWEEGIFLKKFLKKLKAGGKKVAGKIVNWWKTRKRFKTKDNESHKIFFKGKGKSVQLMIASKPQPYTTYLRNLSTKNQTQQFKDSKKKALDYARRVDAFANKLSDRKFESPKNDGIRKLKKQYLNQLNKAMDSLVDVTKNLGVDLAPKKSVVKHSGNHGHQMEVEANPLSKIEGNTKGSPGNQPYAAAEVRAY